MVRRFSTPSVPREFLAHPVGGASVSSRLRSMPIRIFCISATPPKVLVSDRLKPVCQKFDAHAQGLVAHSETFKAALLA
jgi:hypothetical protein